MENTVPEAKQRQFQRVENARVRVTVYDDGEVRVTPTANMTVVDYGGHATLTPVE